MEGANLWGKESNEGNSPHPLLGMKDKLSQPPPPPVYLTRSMNQYKLTTTSHLKRHQQIPGIKGKELDVAIN